MDPGLEHESIFSEYIYLYRGEKVGKIGECTDTHFFLQNGVWRHFYKELSFLYVVEN